MNTRYRQWIRTGRYWLSCAARSTRHRVTLDTLDTLDTPDTPDTPEWIQEQNYFSEE